MSEEKTQKQESIILNSQGKAWTKDEDAQKALEKREDLNKDQWKVIKGPEGFVIADIFALAQKGMTAPAASAKEAAPEEKFYNIVMQDKSSDNDPDDITVIVNGEIIQLTRGVEIIIPASYKEALDHATYKKHQIIPGKPRKSSKPIRRFPYQLNGEATREEYLTMLKAGTKQNREAMTLRPSEE